jgi:flagellar basal-body rod modification protein FlgD
MAAAGIFAHQMTAGRALTGNATAVKPLDSSSSGSSSPSDDSSLISANDFLTLLVTEMQNQDPTADTDPNAYVNQLVQINSLEQLISINQTLTTSLDAPTSSSDAANANTSASPIEQGAATHAPAATSPATTVPETSAHRAAAMAAAQHVPGNLSVPADNPAAERVGRALDGHTRTKPAPGRLPQIF